MNHEKNYSPGALVWQRFKKNKLHTLSLGVILLSVLICLFAYFIVPDSSPNANEMNLTLALKKPGFRVKMLKIDKEIIPENKSFLTTLVSGKESPFKSLAINGYQIKGDTLYCSLFVGEQSETTVLERIPVNKLVRNKSQISQFLKERVYSRTFYLGTDRYGRDLLSRLLLGTRVTLSVGFISVFISLLIGISLGAAAGYYKGKTDAFIMWFINVIWSVPTLLLVIAITLVLGKGFWQIFVAIGLTMWVDVARVVRGQVLSVSEMEFVEAGRALGFSPNRIIFRHILPNIAGPIIVVAASNFASAILLEAGLSFLGVGAQPPTPSWGTMIKENYPYILMNLAYLALLPGMAIMFMVLAFNLMGKGLRDAFDTKDMSTGLS